MANRRNATKADAKEGTAAPLAGSGDLDEIVELRGDVLYIRKCAARANEPQHQEIDLRTFTLPASPFESSPIPLTARPELTDAVVQALRGYSSRVTAGGTNSTHTAIASALRSMVKAIEFGWLHGAYRLTDWSEQIATQLVERLGAGGWANALKLDERSSEVFATVPEAELRKYITKSHAKSGGYSIKLAFAPLIGTNCINHELIGVKAQLVAHLRLPENGATQNNDPRTRVKKRSHEAGMVDTHLRQELAWINLLSEANTPIDALPFVPFPDTVKLAAQYGRKGGRTGNLTPDSVAKLLKEGTWWIEECAAPVIGMLTDIASALAAAKAAGELLDPRCVDRALANSAHRVTIERLIGDELTSVGLQKSKQGFSLKSMVYCLASACFVTIAFFNARRKNELLHRKNGLHRQALRLVDVRLNLYECEFYIEKTYKIYVPFYVGQATKNAIGILERMSDLARAIDEIRLLAKSSAESKEDKLFQLPRVVGRSSGGGEQWFDFNASANGISRGFVDRALGADRKIRVHPHMFRRAYALIYHYRYEFGTITALAQQLGHFDLDTVFIYVTDGPGGVDTATAASYARHSPKVAAAIAANRMETEKEIKAVGIERVLEVAQQVVDGTSDASGGFARLVTRLHQRLGRRLDYSRLTPTKQAQKLGEAFVAKGHEFRPMRHANCVASGSRRSKSAGCYSKRLERNRPEDATPTTCSKCAYSHYVREHMRLWEEDAAALQQRVAALGTNSISGRAATISLKNLQAAIRLRSHRTERDGVAA
jgi:hypothetical protein